MQRENPCFVKTGSLCSLAQQSLLCVKHLRTEVLNNIFTFPADVSSLFGDNSTVLALSSSDAFSRLEWQGCTRVVGAGSACCGASSVSGERLGRARRAECSEPRLSTGSRGAAPADTAGPGGQADQSSRLSTSFPETQRGWPGGPRRPDPVRKRAHCEQE